MMKNLSFFLLSAVIVIFSSCKTYKSSIPPSTGKTNEILVITNDITVWHSKVGQAITDFFSQPLPGLPQPEPMFDLIHFPQASFTPSLQNHHNILIIDINPAFAEPLIETKKDLWSKPQRVIKMTVPNADTFLTQFDSYKEAFLNLYNEGERIRAIAAFGSVENTSIKNQLIKGFGLAMDIPGGFKMATITPNFAWIRHDAQKFEQSIMVYFSAYTDTNNFNPQNLINRRDTITKKYISGPSEGSYMKIAKIEPPITKRIDFKGNFAVEMRGMWELEGDFMGGPFLSYTFVDQRNNRLITIDGYVYNPNEEKRNLIRQLEAIIYSIQFPDKKQQ